MLRKIGRVLILIVAVLVIVLSLGGIIGAWSINNVITNVTLKIFSVVEGGANVVDTAVSRVDALVQDSRTEVQQTETTITTVAANIQENRPVLTALSERLETRLGPTVDKIQEAVAPARDALVTINNVVSFANSIPFVQEHAPQLGQLEEVFTKLGGLSADLQQLRTTLREATLAKADELTQELVTTLTRLTSRVDNWLAEIQTGIQGIRSDIAAFQVRVETTRSALLLIYTIVSLVATLLYIWVIYSQIVVIRHHWRRPAPVLASVAPGSSEPAQGRAEVGSPPSESADRVVAGLPETSSVDTAPDRAAIPEEVPPTASEAASPTDAMSDKNRSGSS